MLWIAIWLPKLSLEVHAADNVALAICDGERILHANETARQAGVDAGMRRATGLALCPALRLLPRDLIREQTALRAVAMWALQFTPNVSLILPQEDQPDSPMGLLLEVEGSIRLFGGLAPIRRALRRGLAVQGYAAQIATAPVPQAAWVLAQAHDGLRVASHAELRDALSPLPIRLLEAGKACWEKLKSVGQTTIGDLLSLPRSGVARRFSEKLLDELDRALGAKADPRIWFEAPLMFDVRIELAARVDTAEALLFAARRLIVQLSGWLASRHAATRMAVFDLVHEDRAPTSLSLQLADASNDADRFTLLLREMLAKTQLVAPVYEISLRCERIVSAAAASAQLFPGRQTEHEGLARLLERLQARLGREQIVRFRLHEDHRPELAFRAEDASVIETHRTAVSVQPRPLWLLPAPIALTECNSVPFYGTSLTLIAGPERIEGGWWDESWVERDYFIARDDQNALLWIFRSRVPNPLTRQGWYLHGKFG